MSVNKLILVIFTIFALYVHAQEFDCEKDYNEKKTEYEKKFGDIKTIDYDCLGKTIINNFDLKKITSKNIIIALPGNEYCPVGVPKQKCKYFYPAIPYYNEYNVWSGENFLLIQTKAKKNIIPTTTGLGYFTDKKEFERIFKNNKYEFGLQKLAKVIFYPNSEKKFLYFPINSKKLIIEVGDANNSDAYENSIVEPRVKHINSKEVRVEYIFMYYPTKSYYQTYKYINDQWILTENITM